MFFRRSLAIALAGLGGLTAVTSARAQDLEPRAYAATPIGVHFLVAGAGRSSGSVVIDPSLPVEDVHAIVGAATVGAGTTFSLWGRTALIAGALPVARVRATGRVGEVAQAVSRVGIADPRIKLSVNFLGGRALRPSEFAKSRTPTIVGASVVVGPPLGEYFADKLINLGANRWAFKPEVGISRAIGNWTVEGYSGVWFFTTNDTFYPGTSIRTQDPIVTLQAHVSYTFRPRLWVAFDATWYRGGSTTIDEVAKADLQRNSRAGATVSVPLLQNQSIKVAYSAGTSTRIGGDFDTVAVAWQLSWITAPRSP
jgi:hypothetical protein